MPVNFVGRVRRITSRLKSCSSEHGFRGYVLCQHSASSTWGEGGGRDDRHVHSSLQIADILKAIHRHGVAPHPILLAMPPIKLLEITKLRLEDYQTVGKLTGFHVAV